MQPLCIALPAALLLTFATATHAQPQVHSSSGLPRPHTRQRIPPSLDCSKPDVPATGFAVTVEPQQTITYTDGYHTRGHLVRPSIAPPCCGWPLVVHVHGSASSKDAILQRSIRIAERGFAVWAYDVRGQGSSIQLNPAGQGHTLMGAPEKADLAEQIYFAQARYPSIIDRERTAVTGFSQGGSHSWVASAYSGKPLAVPGRDPLVFPQIDAAVPMGVIPDFHVNLVREGGAFSTKFVRALLAPPSQVMAPQQDLYDLWASYFYAQDPEGLVALWESDAHRLWADELSTTTTPVLWVPLYFDSGSPPLPGLPQFEQIPPTTPAHVLISTGGHGSPDSDYEEDFKDELRIRWLDRFLWDVDNDVEHEASGIRALMPSDLARLNDPTDPWGHRYDDDLDAPDLEPLRLYLTDTGALSGTEPTVSGTPTTIAHQVAPSYTPAAWASSPAQGTLTTLFANIPLSEHAFETAPFVAEVELGGTVPISLSITPDHAVFQLSAMLEARVPGEAQDLPLATFGRAVRNATPGVPMRLEFSLPNIVSVLPAGSQFVLRLRNHWFLEAPMPVAQHPTTITAPFFDSSSVAVHHGPGSSASFLELPLRQEVGVTLTSALHVLDDDHPVTMPLHVEGGVARAGQPYELWIGASGQVPGTPLGLATLPLNADDLTSQVHDLTRNPPAWLSGFTGVLDSNGQATAHLDWAELLRLVSKPAPPRFTFAISTGSGAELATSSPIDVIVR